MAQDVFSQVFSAVSTNASSGAQTTGKIANWLIQAGLSVSAISQLLNGVATSAAATPQEVAYVQQEMQYLQSQYYQQQQTNWILPVALLLGAMFLASRSRS